jgi:hypothetical protein
MSQSNVVIPPVASADISATVTSNVVPTAASVPDADPSWLKSRLERERAKGAKDALVSAGFATETEAKAAAAAAKAATEANKSAETKAAELAANLTAANAETARLRAATEEYAARMMVGYTAEQQAAIKSLAGDDAARQIAAIAAIAPTWANLAAAAAAAAESSTTTATTPAASLRPGTTAPAPSAPAGTVPALPTARSTYDAMKTTNPFAAAQYGTTQPSIYTPKT